MERAGTWTRLRLRARRKLTVFLDGFGRRKSWRRPSCSCKDFVAYGKCRHLDRFRGAAEASELGLHSSMSLDSLAGRDVLSRNGFGSLRSVWSGTLPRRRRDESQLPSPEPALPSSPENRRGSRPLVLSTSALAIAHGDADVGEMRVPAGVPALPAGFELLDNLSSVGRVGSHVFRAATNDAGVVMAKVLLCQAPLCLPHHNEAFNSELELLHQLKHPNVIAMLGYGEAEMAPGVFERHLALEFAADSLADLVRHRAAGAARLSFLEVRKYALDVAEAVTFLHAQGVVHRDLTAENVLMVPIGYPAGANWTAVMRKHLRLSRSMHAVAGAVRESLKRVSGARRSAEPPSEEALGQHQRETALQNRRPPGALTVAGKLRTLSTWRPAGLRAQSALGKELSATQSQQARPRRTTRGDSLTEPMSGRYSQPPPRAARRSPKKPAEIAAAAAAAAAGVPLSTPMDPGASVIGLNLVAKVAHFECAARLQTRDLAEPLRTRTRITSPRYMAPEMCRGDAYGAPVDVWALGALLYEMIAREAPFERQATLAQVEDALLTRRDFPPGSAGGKWRFLAPPDFEPLELAMRDCLQFDPDSRPAAADALAGLQQIELGL